MMRWAVMRGIRAGVPPRRWLPVLRRNAAGFSPRLRGMMSRHTWCGRHARMGLNLLRAAMAAMFARSSIVFYLQSHGLIGDVFFVEQAWFVVLFLIRWPPRAVSDRAGSWLLAAAGTFGGLLLRPEGAHPEWCPGRPGPSAGGPSSGSGIACRAGQVVRVRGSRPRHGDPRTLYVVRHPVYAVDLLIQCGYVLRAVSLRNIAVLAVATGW
jgi:hypothetical protein